MDSNSFCVGHMYYTILVSFIFFKLTLDSSSYCIVFLNFHASFPFLFLFDMCLIAVACKPRYIRINTLKVDAEVVMQELGKTNIMVLHF